MCGSFHCSMWDLVPQPGIEPVPLHWEHGVLTTGPPGKSLKNILTVPQRIENRVSGFLGSLMLGSVVKNLPANAGDMSSSPDPGRSHMLRNN